MSSDTSLVKKSLSKWVEFFYGPIFRVIGFFYQSYQANRARVANFKANWRVAAVLKIMAILILAAWILVWLFASDASRSRLSNEIKQTFGEFEFNSGQ